MHRLSWTILMPSASTRCRFQRWVVSFIGHVFGLSKNNSHRTRFRTLHDTSCLWTVVILHIGCSLRCHEKVFSFHSVPVYDQSAYVIKALSNTHTHSQNKRIHSNDSSRSEQSSVLASVSVALFSSSNSWLKVLRSLPLFWTPNRCLWCRESF